MEETIGDIMGTIEKGEDVAVRVDINITSRAFESYICPQCSRLLLFDNRTNTFVKSYSPE